VDPALVELAERVLGSPAEAEDWLSAPHPLLGDRTPRAVAATPEGASQVRELLERLEESLPA
jgi:putative toxin-antitoxin system antitoxin component (TIGR02293 family)